MSEEELAAKVEAIGVGYTRMEQCVMDLVKAIHLLVEQNAAMFQSMVEKEAEEQDEPVGYLSLKRR
jgi:hypothetical protein